MAISYNKLWKLLIDKGITRTELRHKAGLTSNVIANMGKGESVQLEVLRKICQELKCGSEDIVEIIPDNSKTSESEATQHGSN